ncbi:MAG: hypothetical protein ABH828_00400 [archaeon]
MDHTELTELLRNKNIIPGSKVTVCYDARPDIDKVSKYSKTGITFATYVGMGDGAIWLSYKGPNITDNDILTIDEHKEYSNGTTINYDRLINVEKNIDPINKLLLYFLNPDNPRPDLPKF